MVEVVFRCDASQAIGAGHVMRCLVLADHLASQGKSSLFICREHRGHCADFIKSHGHKVVLIPLEKGGPVWLGGPIEADAAFTIETLQKTKAEWLVADHYNIDVRWEQIIKDKTGVQILVIDGQANRAHACDRLLDPAFSDAGVARWHGLVPDTCKIFSGIRYALLRPEFKQLRAAIELRPKVRDSAFRVLIGFGGFDSVNATATALEALRGLARSNLHVDVVVGAQNQHLAVLQSLTDGLSWVKLHVAPSNLAAMMAKADCGICAGGTMLLEFCSVLTPALVLSVADNQREMVQSLTRKGMALNLGDFDHANPSQALLSIKKAISELLDDRDRLEAIRNCLKSLNLNDQFALNDVLELSA